MPFAEPTMPLERPPPALTNGSRPQAENRSTGQETGLALIVYAVELTILYVHTRSDLPTPGNSAPFPISGAGVEHPHFFHSSHVTDNLACGNLSRASSKRSQQLLCFWICHELAGCSGYTRDLSLRLEGTALLKMTPRIVVAGVAGIGHPGSVCGFRSRHLHGSPEFPVVPTIVR